MRHRNEGQSLVEMALTLPILVLLLFGILELGRMLDAWIVATNAAREGARYAAVGTPSDQVIDRTYAYLQEGLAGRSDVAYSKGWISVSYAQAPVPGTPVTVTAQVRLTIFTPLFQAIVSPNPFPVQGSATMALQSGG